MQDNSSISNFKILFKWGTFLVIVALAVMITGHFYEKSQKHNQVMDFAKQRFTDFYAQPEDSIDMVFIGSSHAYCSFDPEIFDAALGSNSFQLGTPLQHIDSSKYVLKEVLKTQKPKVVVMEVYWDMLDDDFVMKQADTLFAVLKDPATEREYVNEDFPINEWVKYQINTIRFQQDYIAYKNSELKTWLEEDYDLKIKAPPANGGEEYYRSKGYVYCDCIIPDEKLDETNQFKNTDGEKVEFSDVQMNQLQEMVDICKENGIELVLMTAPIATVSMTYIENYDVIHNYIAGFSEKNQIPYLDFNLVPPEELSLALDEFSDDAHLNDYGVQKVSGYSIPWLQENTAYFK